MKHECEVVRDLMPLYVDGTASERSCAMVDEHAEECEPCREMLEEMRQEVIPAPSQEASEEVVQKLRKHRWKRVVALMMLGLTLSMVLGLTGLMVWRKVWNYYYNDFCELVPLEEYSVELLPMEETKIILTMKNLRIQSLNSMYDTETDDLYFWSTMTRKPKRAAWPDRIVPGVNLFYHPDCGYAWMDWNGECHLINHIYRGAPDWMYEGNPNAGREVLAQKPEDLGTEDVEAWFSELREKQGDLFKQFEVVQSIEP